MREPGGCAGAAWRRFLGSARSGRRGRGSPRAALGVRRGRAASGGPNHEDPPPERVRPRRRFRRQRIAAGLPASRLSQSGAGALDQWILLPSPGFGCLVGIACCPLVTEPHQGPERFTEAVVAEILPSAIPSDSAKRTRARKIQLWLLPPPRPA